MGRIVFSTQRRIAAMAIAGMLGVKREKITIDQLPRTAASTTGTEGVTVTKR